MSGAHEISGLRLQLLGGFELRDGARVIIDRTWPHSRARDIVKLLALQPGRSLHREQIGDVLWPGAAPDRAANNLDKNIHFLRHEVMKLDASGPLLERRTGMVSLAARVVVDVDEFRTAAEEAERRGDDPELYDAALSLYSGELLPEDIYAEWTAPHREALRKLRRRLLAESARLYEEAGETDRAAARLELLVLDDPAHEEPRMGLMRIYARAGDRALALRHYEELRGALERELGVEPSDEIRSLHDDIASGRLGAAPRPRAPAPAPAGGGPLFVGRERELEILHTALNEAMAGRGRLVVICGEPGIGKTTTVEAFAAQAGSAGALALTGRCMEGGGAPAYWPWLQLIRGYIAATDAPALRAELGDGAPVIAQIEPQLAPIVSGLPEPPPLEAEQARFRLFDSIAGFLRRASEARPVVLILEDLHDADRSSLLLLRFLARELKRARVLIIGTYREEEVRNNEALQQALASLAREKVERVEVAGFTPPEVHAYIRAAASVEPTEPFVRAAHERTEGNPLFLRELLSVLREDGALDLNSAGLADLPVPESVRDTITARLRLLTEPTRNLLAVASVVGREFGFDVLRRVVPGGDLLQQIDEALTARIIVEVPGSVGRFSFSHALIREVLYGSLGFNRRVELHRAIGQALEDTYGIEADRYLSQLAYHFVEAIPAGGDAAKAVAYAERAALQAAAALAYDEAVRSYQRALQAIESATNPDQQHRCDMLLALAEALKDAGDQTQSRETFLRAATVARALGDAERLARAAMGYEGAGVTTGAVDDTLVALLREALAAIDHGDTPMRARLLGRLAMALYWAPGARDERYALSEEAMRMARRIGDPSTLAYALRARHFSLGPESPEERLGVSTEIVRLAQEARDQETALSGHGTRLMDFLELGDIRGVDGELEAIRRLADELRQPLHYWARDVREAMRAMLAGDFAEGERLANQAREIGARSQDPNVLSYFGVQMVTLGVETGRLPEMEPYIRAFIGQFPAVAAWRSALAMVQVMKGDREAARDELARVAGDDFAALTHDWTWLGALTLFSQVASYVEDRDVARSIYQLMAPYAGRTVVVAASVSCWGAVSRYLGIVSSTLGDWDEAAHHYDTALEMNARMEATPYVANTLLDYAEMLHRRGDDRDRIAEYVGRAAEMAKQLGMKRLQSQASALLAPAAGASPGDAAFTSHA